MNSRPLKILLVSDPYYPYPSGISEYTFYLSKYLKKHRNEVQILTTHYKGEKEEKGVIRFGKVLMIPMNKSYATMAFGLDIPSKVKNLLSNNDFDIVHLNGPFFPSLSFFALHYSKTKNIAAFLNAGFKFYNFGSKIFRIVYKKYLNKIDGYFAISETAKLAMEPYFPGDYEIIPAGVDVEFFESEGEKFEIEGYPKILFLGRLDERKGVLKIINVFSKLLKIKKDAKLIIAGKGPLDGQAKQMVKDLRIERSTIFTGYVKKDDIPKYYRTADIYCSPALGGESFGIVLLEAMACGTPVVASNIHGYSQVIENLKDGVLFDPLSEEDLLSKLILLSDDKNLRETLKKNGKKKSLDYSWENVSIRIENFYRKIISRS
ncbi:MAG: glycosyltransferase family 4 protein [candidate division WOR-3 bacterium]